MNERLNKYWKEKSIWSKVSDLIFFILVVTMLFPQGRMAIGGAINRVKAKLTTPTVIVDQEVLSNVDYNWSMVDKVGKSVNLSDFKGKILFINMWATWCPPCVGEMPEIQKLYNQFADEEEVVFMMISNEPMDKQLKFVNKHNYTFPVYSAQSPTPSILETRSIPTTYIIAKSGKIVVRETGAANWGGEQMVTLVNQLLAE